MKEEFLTVGTMKKNKFKNAILRILTLINVISAILMACCLDSKSTIPMIVLAINMLVLYILYLIERRFYDEEK